MGDHMVKHGDGVKDIAFTVEDCDFLVQVKVLIFCNAAACALVFYFLFFAKMEQQRKPGREEQIL